MSADPAPWFRLCAKNKKNTKGFARAVGYYTQDNIVLHLQIMTTRSEQFVRAHLGALMVWSEDYFDASG